MKGWVDGCELPRTLLGWALEEDDLNNDHVFVYAYKNEALIGVCRANIYRPDLGLYGNGKYGFCLSCSTNITADDILRGDVKVFAGSLVRDVKSLSFTKSAIEGLHHGLNSSQTDIARHIIDDADGALAKRLFSVSPNSALDIVAAFHSARVPLTKEMSQINIPVGYLSIDRTTVIGKEGFLYLVGGRNEVSSLYNGKFDTHNYQETANKWINLMRERSLLLGARKIRYMQIIIPEKQSVIPEYYPWDIECPSHLLREIEARIRSDADANKFYYSVFDMIRRSNALNIFQRADTHFTPRGAFECVRFLLGDIGLTLTKDPEFSDVRPMFPDLGLRMVGVPTWDYVSYPRSDGANDAHPIVQKRHSPENNRHVGAYICWSNERPISPLRVLAFGNSFTAYGDSERELSWWFSRYFKEYHFFWSPSLNEEILEEVKPDIVVCQTIERFLRQVPGR